MKSRAAWTALLALGSGLLARESRAGTGEPLPSPYPEARYHQMSAQSPFAVATANAAPPATPDFAAQLYVAGVARIAGTDFAAIKSRDPDKPNAFFLAAGETSNDGLQVLSIHWSDQRGGSTVEVSRENAKALLAFDQAQILATPKPVMFPPSNLPPNVQRNGPIQVIHVR